MTMSIVHPDAWPVQGGDVERLFQSVAEGHVPHAILLAGRSDETQVLGRFIATTLLCSSASPRPCGQCRTCLQFASGVHPNWYEVVPEGKSVRTQAVEELQTFLTRRSHGQGPLVYLVQSIEKATPVAANRLLKTLEEPSSHIIAILTAENVRQVLPTILSRCYVYRISSPSRQEDGEAPSADLSEDDGENLKNSPFAALSQGVVQWTESLLRKVEPAIVLANEISKLKSDEAEEETVRILIEWLNSLMHYAFSKRESTRFSHYREQLREQAALTDGQKLAELIRIAVDTRIRFGSHVVSQLNYEQMCIRMRRVLDGLHGSGSPL